MAQGKRYKNRDVVIIVLESDRRFSERSPFYLYWSKAALVGNISLCTNFSKAVEKAIIHFVRNQMDMKTHQII